MRFIVALAFAIFVGLMLQTPAEAQDADYTPYSWPEGDLALVVPASWMLPSQTQVEGTATLMLTPDNSKIDAPRIFIEVIAAPTQRPFDSLAERLAAWGISIGTPTQTTLAGIGGLSALAAGPVVTPAELSPELGVG